MKRHTSLLVPLALAALTGCAAAQPALKTAFKNDFLIGAALNESQFAETNSARLELIRQQFNATTSENVLKWEHVHPAPDRYDFGPADRYVAFGEKYGMFIVGHTLVWHNQTPAWVFQDDQGRPMTRAALLARMRDHIHTVVGRYRGRIKGWDVVNEALNEDGTRRQSPWQRIIGDDYIEKAFAYAHEADPSAELYYNDFSLENATKRDGAVALIKQLQAAGVPVAGIGTQEHIKLDWPTPQQVNDMLTAFGRLGIKVMVTELDVDVLPGRGANRTAEVSLRQTGNPTLNPYTNGLPDHVQQALAQRYADIFTVYREHRGTLARVTFWGVTDGDSWLNNWPIPGRTSYPLLFDRQGRPKPAFDAVLKTAPIVP